MGNLQTDTVSVLCAVTCVHDVGADTSLVDYYKVGPLCSNKSVQPVVFLNVFGKILWNALLIPYLGGRRIFVLELCTCRSRPRYLIKI